LVYKRGVRNDVKNDVKNAAVARMYIWTSFARSNWI